MARPYCDKRPSISPEGITDVGDWFTPGDQETKPYRFFLAFERDGIIVKQAVYPDHGEDARKAPQGRVRVFVAGQNNPELGDAGEVGRTMRIGGELTEQPAVSDWVNIGPAPQPQPDENRPDFNWPAVQALRAGFAENLRAATAKTWGGWAEDNKGELDRLVTFFESGFQGRPAERESVRVRTRRGIALSYLIEAMQYVLKQR